MIEDGHWNKDNNPLKNAPHTNEFLMSDRCGEGYPIRYAAYPLPFVMERGKFWPPIRRVNDLFGDKNPDVTNWVNQNFYESSDKIVEKNKVEGDKNLEQFRKK